MIIHNDDDDDNDSNNTQIRNGGHIYCLSIIMKHWKSLPEMGSKPSWFDQRKHKCPDNNIIS